MVWKLVAGVAKSFLTSSEERTPDAQAEREIARLASVDRAPAAAQALVAMGSSAVPALARALADPDVGPAAEEVLARMGPDALAPLVAAAVAADGGDVAGAAGRLVTELGADAVPHLLCVVGRGDAPEVARAVRLLERIPMSSWRVDPGDAFDVILDRHLDDEALPTSLLPPLLRAVDPERALRRLAQLSREETNKVRRGRAYEALPMVDAVRAVPVLVDAIRNNSADDYAQGQLAGIADPAALEQTIAALEDDRPHVRAALATTLAGIGGESARRALHRLCTEDPDDTVREAARQGLERLRAA